MTLRRAADRLSAARAALRYCNSYSRLPTLIALWEGMEVEADEWLTLLGEEWPSCDNIGEYLTPDSPLWLTPLSEVLEGDASGAPMMTAEERAALAAMPEKITVYRGCYALNKWGVCWSTDRAVASRFPTLHRYQGDGPALLVKATADKAKVAAVKLDRNELEVITWRPRHISTTRI